MEFLLQVAKLRASGALRRRAQTSPSWYVHGFTLHRAGVTLILHRAGVTLTLHRAVVQLTLHRAAVTLTMHRAVVTLTPITKYDIPCVHYLKTHTS